MENSYTLRLVAKIFALKVNLKNPNYAQISKVNLYKHGIHVFFLYLSVFLLTSPIFAHSDEHSCAITFIQQVTNTEEVT